MIRAIAVTVGVIATLALALFKWWLKEHSAEAKRKQAAKETFDEAVDKGDRIGVLDGFNDTNQ